MPPTMNAPVHAPSVRPSGTLHASTPRLGRGGAPRREPSAADVASGRGAGRGRAPCHVGSAEHGFDPADGRTDARLARPRRTGGPVAPPRDDHPRTARDGRHPGGAGGATTGLARGHTRAVDVSEHARPGAGAARRIEPETPPARVAVRDGADASHDGPEEPRAFHR